jgi:hypothetical protein
MFVEAASEEEVRELLEGLPLSELGTTSIVELKSFKELQEPATKGARRGGLLP